VLAAMEVDGKRVGPGTVCRGECGSAMSLVCTVHNCTRSVLTNVTVEIVSVSLVSTCSASSVDSDASDRHAVFDNSAVVVGCLMSSFPQVRPLNWSLCCLSSRIIILHSLTYRHNFMHCTRLIVTKNW